MKDNQLKKTTEKNPVDYSLEQIKQKVLNQLYLIVEKQDLSISSLMEIYKIINN